MAKPTRPSVPITIDGTEYKLFFDFNAIADVEEKLAAKGVEVNLIAAKWGSLTATSTRALFVAGLKANHAGLTDAEARALYGAADPEEVVLAIGKGYRDFSPESKPEDEAEPADPPQPGS